MVDIAVVAFLASLGAGLCTSIGAALVFVPRLYSPLMLSGFLSVAAGVMIYLSLTAILQKSFSAYARIPAEEGEAHADDGHDDEHDHGHAA